MSNIGALSEEEREPLVKQSVLEFLGAALANG